MAQKTQKAEKLPKSPSPIKPSPQKQIRPPEVMKIRDLLIEAIKETEHFWLIYKDENYGLAGFLHFPSGNKVYIEIMFYPQNHKKAPFEAYSPFENVIPIKKITEKYAKQKSVLPKIVLNEIHEYLRHEIATSSVLLIKVVRDLREEYESYPILNNPHHRKCYLFYDKKSLWFDIDFGAYPKPPKVRFYPESIKQLGIKNTWNQAINILDTWDEKKPPMVSKIIEQIDKWASTQIYSTWDKSRQNISGKNLQFTSVSPTINFELHRGEELGLVADSDCEPFIEAIFKGLSTGSNVKSGSFVAFGENITKDPKNYVIWVKSELDKTDKADIRKKILKRDESISKLYVAQAFFKEAKRSTRFYSSGNRGVWIWDLLRDLNLYELRNEKISDLSELEYFRLTIGLAMIKSSPIMILSNVPVEIFSRMDFAQFYQFIGVLKEKYHICFILAAPQEFLKESEQIINFGSRKRKMDACSLDTLLEQLPQSGEIIKIQFIPLTDPEIKKLKEIKNTTLIEDRYAESYTLFSKQDVEELIMTLFKNLGAKIYNFKRFKPSLAEYLEFIDNT